MHVLFVCLGNICRSPIAESLFRKKVIAEGLSDKVTTASRATSDFNEGKEPYIKTKEILDKYQVDYQGIYSEQIKASDFAAFDYIIGMDQQNVTDLKKIAPKQEHSKIYTLLDILPDIKVKDVPDPYYTGDFEYSYQLIDQGTTAWLEKLKERFQ